MVNLLKTCSSMTWKKIFCNMWQTFKTPSSILVGMVSFIWFFCHLKGNKLHVYPYYIFVIVDNVSGGDSCCDIHDETVRSLVNGDHILCIRFNDLISRIWKEQADFSWLPTLRVIQIELELPLVIYCSSKSSRQPPSTLTSGRFSDMKLVVIPFTPWTEIILLETSDRYIIGVITTGICPWYEGFSKTINDL